MIDAPTAKPKRRPSARPSGRTTADRVKATLILDSTTDLKLSVLAKMRGVDRSVLANQLIAEGVRSVSISIRGERPAEAESGDRGTLSESAA